MRYSALLSVLLVALSASAQLPSALSGKSGSSLLNAIAVSARPQRLYTADHMELFAQIDADPANADYIIDRWGTAPMLAVGDYKKGIAECHIAPAEWWAKCRDYGDTLALDLHNIVPCNIDVPSKKSVFPPYTTDHVDYDNGAWQCGSVNISGMDFTCYTPAPEYQGDFARVLMYMVAVYPCDYWDIAARLIFSNNPYPVLNAYGAEQLMAWHRADPVSECERQRNTAIAAIQGNSNPFVDAPELAEYLWGDKRGDTFAEDEESPVALHSTYRLEEKRIYLTSPFVPQDATWSVNGKAVNATFVETASLGVGTHEFAFSAGAVSGKILIKIVP